MFTDADRAKGLDRRRKQKEWRIRQVHQMYAEGMSAKLIARKLEVGYRTVLRDLKETPEEVANENED